MKPVSDALWHFIKHLSSGEKLFLRRNYIGLSTIKDPLYILLFDAIDKQPVYNETDILKKLAPEINPQNIAFQKHYLYQQICNALVQYESRKNEDAAIFNQIQLIQIFRRKGMLDEAKNLWRKTMMRARQSEAQALIIMLRNEFERMLLWSDGKAGYDELNTLFKDNIVTYNEYAEVIVMRDIYAEVLMLKRNAHFDWADTSIPYRIEALLLLLPTLKKNLGDYFFWYRHYYRLCKATLLYLSNKNLQEAYQYVLDIIADWKQHGDYLKTDSEKFMDVLSMLNYLGTPLNMFKAVETAFNDPFNDKITDPILQAEFEALKYLTLNKLYHKMARYKEVADLIVYFKSRHDKWENKLNIETNRDMYISCSISCFVLENYDDALFFIKRGLLYFKDNTRIERVSLAQLFLLLIVYNMNNIKLFEAQYRSTYNYFYKKKNKHPFEKIIIQCLHGTFYLRNFAEKAKEYNKALTLLEQHKDNEVQKKVFSMFNFPRWLTSRVERVSYQQLVRMIVAEQTQAREQEQQ